MCSSLLYLLPQELDRVVVWRIGRKLKDRETILVCFQESSGDLAGVVLGPILDEDHVLHGLVEYLAQKELVSLRVEALFQALVEESSREKINCAEHLVAFAFARYLDNWLLANAQV
ncbi:MAG: hypothetical protein SXV54_12680 [Chloroflexota bacterium]|nr:hypothetical protein [Chloroflexota bacterium]